MACPSPVNARLSLDLPLENTKRRVGGPCTVSPVAWFIELLTPVIIDWTPRKVPATGRDTTPIMPFPMPLANPEKPSFLAPWIG